MNGRADWRDMAVLTAALGLCAALLWYFHNWFWWPVDDGVYAYVAQRINAGDVMHRDLIDLHAGYVNLLHALAFRIFGEDLLSLRYPLAGLTLIQAGLAAALFWPRGPWQAASAALVVTAFSFIQFLNPSANWYALFLFFVTVWVLTRVDTTRASGALLVGFLIGMCFLFRQLTGVFLAMGVLTWLLLRPQPAHDGHGILARLLLAVMAVGLAGYLWSKGSIAGFVLFGLWPLVVLLAGCATIRLRDSDVALLLIRLFAGACLAAAPLVTYHIVEGSLGVWLHDILFTALLIHQQDFISRISFFLLALGGAIGLTQWREPAVALNGVLWLTLVAAPATLGAFLLRGVLQRNEALLSHPLPITAGFFAMVAVHYQIPIYLLFAISPVLAALLMICGSPRPRLTASMLLALAAIAVVYQAGEPLSRNLDGIIRGDHIELAAEDGLPRARIKMERVDQEVYQQLLGLIAAAARPDEALFAFPMEPELNFLANRPAPVPYYSTAMGLLQESDVTDTMARLERAAPIFVVVRRDDKYLTSLSQDLLAQIRLRDSAPEPYGPFDLYRLPARPSADAAPTARE